MGIGCRLKMFSSEECDLYCKISDERNNGIGCRIDVDHPTLLKRLAPRIVMVDLHSIIRALRKGISSNISDIFFSGVSMKFHEIY